MHSELVTKEGCRLQPVWLLREAPSPPRHSAGAYESEGSERISRGSVALPSGARWLSQLEVPLAGGHPALLTVWREGQDAAPIPDQASLVVPVGEADALVSLIVGIVIQARADGVLQGHDEAQPERSA